MHDMRHALEIQLVEMAFGHAHVLVGVDPLDGDVIERLPKRPRRICHHHMHRRTIKRDDRNLARTNLDNLEILCGKRRMRLGKQHCPLARDLGLRHLHDLHRIPAKWIESSKAARHEQPHQSAVARQKSTLIVANDHAEL